MGAGEAFVRRKTRKAIALVGAALVVGLLPVLGMLGLGYVQTIERSHQRLDNLAEAVARRTEAVLLSVEAVLADLRYEARNGCTEVLVSNFRDRTVSASAVEVVGLIDTTGRLGCTTFGLHQPPLFVDAGPIVAPPGSVVRFSRLEQSRFGLDPLNAAELAMDGGARLIVAFLPSSLLDPVPDDSLGKGGRLVVSVAGLTLGEMGTSATRAAGFLNSVRDAGIYGVTITASVGRDWALALWREEALAIGGLGVAIGGALGGAAYLFGRKRLSLADELKDGLDNREFEIRYQPVIKLATGRCSGAEALIRWRHPDGDLIPPDLFIALAEETGTIIPMTRWLMEEMVVQLGALLRQDRTLHVAINLAPAHTKSFDIVEDARRIVGEHGILPSQILFELTERGLIDDPACREVVLALSQLGSSVAVDDFGTGYSSLAYIDKFKLDYLKLDKAFVSALGAGSPTERLTDVIIDMAKSLGLSIIAEGVETVEQAQHLTAQGVDFAQGWHFSKPLTAPDFVAFVRSNHAATEMLVNEPARGGQPLRNEGMLSRQAT